MRELGAAPRDLKGLKAFGEDCPEASIYILSNGQRKEKHGNILAIPFTQALKDLPTLLHTPTPGKDHQGL